MKRRAYLGLAAAAATMGGCTTSTESASTPTTISGPLVASGGSGYPHEITVDNSLDRAVTLTLVVERGGEEVYNDTYTVTAGTKRPIAGITVETLPADSRTVTILASDAADGEADVGVSVSDCLGDVVFYYEDDRGLRSTYSTC